MTRYTYTARGANHSARAQWQSRRNEQTRCHNPPSFHVSAPVPPFSNLLLQPPPHNRAVKYRSQANHTSHLVSTQIKDTSPQNYQPFLVSLPAKVSSSFRNPLVRLFNYRRRREGPKRKPIIAQMFYCLSRGTDTSHLANQFNCCLIVSFQLLPHQGSNVSMRSSRSARNCSFSFSLEDWILLSTESKGRRS